MAESNQAQYNSKRIDAHEIEHIEIVGRGSYGTVSKAKWNNKNVAVKKFDSITDNKDSIETEIKQLSRVRHPNIIELYGISVKDSCVSLIMEYAEGGSLYNFLHGKTQPKYELSHALSWTSQCAEGVAYMHQLLPQPLIHRDLKPPNLLLFNKGRFLKICDFGTVADKKTQMTNNKGSAMWMAPEVFETSRYTEKCDVFSWGIILWEVLTGKIPYGDLKNPLAIMWRVHEGDRPDKIYGCPKPIERLMQSCWDSEPEKRPSMETVVKLMKEFCDFFPGADKPIDYNSRRNQDVREEELTNDDNLSTIENTEHTYENVTTLNQMKQQQQLSPTKTANQSSQTYTNGIFNSSLGLQIESLNSMASNFNICDTIPDVENEGGTKLLTSGTTSNILEYNRQISNNINYLPTTMNTLETEKRNQIIRNGMIKSQGNVMPSLLVNVDPNAWELSQEDYDNIMRNISKSDGKECLSVTETKTVDDSNNATTDGNDDVNDQSYYLMLDPELQPEQPDPNSRLSQEIFNEHNKLAKEYLKIDEKLYFANDEKDKVLASMSDEERIRKSELIKKIVEKDELLELYNKLQQELAQLNNEQIKNVLNPNDLHQQQLQQIHQHQQQHSYNQQHHQPHLQQLQNNSEHSDSNDESSWVIVPPGNHS